MLINKEMLLDSLKNREWLYYEDAAFAVNYIVEKIRDFPEEESEEETQKMAAERKTTENGFAEFLKEPDDLIRALNRILDALIFTREIQGRNNCNTCGAKYECEYAPEPGEAVTWNCPLWEDPEDDPEEEKHPKISLDKDRGFFVGVGQELKPEINGGDLVALINKVFFTGGDSAKKEEE